MRDRVAGFLSAGGRAKVPPSLGDEDRMTDGSAKRSGRGARPRGPTLVGTLLDGSANAAARASGTSIAPDAWRRIVGARIAERTRPGRLRAGTLLVGVASAVWAHELSFFTEQIAGRAREAGFGVQAVRFYVTRMDAAPNARRRAPPVTAAPLPNDLRDRLSAVDDPELRSVIADAARRWLAVDDERTRARARPRPRKR